MKNKITKIGLSVFFSIMTLFAVNTAFAQVPDAINFQAIARDGDGNIMVETPIMIQLSVLDGGPTGTQVYREIRSLTTNGYGSFSFQIGRDPFMSEGVFASIDWVGGDKYLKVDYDPTATLSFDLTLGTIEFVTVPYAFAARDVVYIDASGAVEGDILVFNGSTGKFEPEQPGASSIEWDNIQNKPDFATVATSGDYDDLTNTPTIPTVPENVSEFTNDAGYLTEYTETQNLSDVVANNNSANGQIKNVGSPTEDHDAATKAYVDALVSDLQAQILELTNLIINPPFTDSRDGNVYQTITIGSQVWMAENLKYLPSVVGPEINSTTIPYYYVYDYNGTVVEDAKATSNYNTYGVLYNWPAAMNGASGSHANPSGVQGICPAGWHLPSDAEWTVLIDYLGGVDVAGGKLKEVGITHWNVPNQGATNESGFTALPGGYYYGPSNFDYVGIVGIWWSASDAVSNFSWYIYVYFNGSAVTRNYGNMNNGYSVRCIKN